MSPHHTQLIDGLPQFLSPERGVPLLEVDAIYSFKGEHIQFKQYLPDNGLLFVDFRRQNTFRKDNGFPVDTEWLLAALRDNHFHRASGKPVRRGFVGCAGEIDADSARNTDKSAEIRYRILNATDELGPRPSPHDLSQVILKVAKIYPEAVERYGRLPSLSTVRSWRCRYGAPGRREFGNCLRKGLKQPRKSRMHPKIVKIVIEEVLKYWSCKLKNIKSTYDDIRARVAILNTNTPSAVNSLSELNFRRPCKDTVRRWVHAFANWDTYYQKFGRAKADAFFKASGNGVTASRILELCMIDHTVIDCIVIDEDGTILGRPVLTLIICAYSRVVFGWHIGFEMASFAAVSECLKHAAKPKLECAYSSEHPYLQDQYGRPHEIIVDNGLEFVGSSFLDACTDVGIHIRICPTKSPTYKQIVERVFATLNSTGIHSFQGTTLNKQKTILQETDYKSSPVYTLKSLRELFDQVIGVYHISPHGGLNEQSPAFVWNQDARRYGIPVFHDVRILDTHVNIAADRKLSRSGIRFESLRYCGPDLNLLLDDFYKPSRKKSPSYDVKIKYNPLDLAEIYVFNSIKMTYVSLPCTNISYAKGLSLYQHKKIRAFAEAQNLAFISDEQMLRARQKLSEAILEASPGLKMQANKALKRLHQSERVQEVIRLRVGDEEAVLIKAEALSGQRKDGGKRTKTPPRRGRSSRTACKTAAPVPGASPAAPPAADPPPSSTNYFTSLTQFERYDHD